MPQTFDHDFIIIGSGFGGSTSALRLVEKGYNVLVLEKGSELGPDDFPVTNWDIRRWLWAPVVGMRGLFQMRPFRHVQVLAGAGVGGGSLVYANTLPIPKKGFYTSGSWADLADWETELAPHYQTARRMLGAAPTDFLSPSDALLKQVAEDRGEGHAFEKPYVSIFMGEPGVTVADPYFDGAGPERTGCIKCGACMTGCRHGAKNTLDKNYLYLARKQGVTVRPDSEVVDVVPLEGGGYRITALEGTQHFSRKEREFTARKVVFSAGPLGTNSLLLRLKQREGSLPGLSPKLGARVRTNCESLILVTVPGSKDDHSQGIAINSLYQTDEHSHLEMVRYGAGSGYFRTMMLPHIGGQHLGIVRFFLMIWYFITHPIKWLRAALVWDFSASTMILLYMRSMEGTLRFVLKGRYMNTELEEGKRPEASIKEATELAREIADKVGGVPLSAFYESFLDIPTTAHILGGCTMGQSIEDGVIDSQHRVFGYDGLYVIDGSTISANPGVNPSLSITALAERAIEHIPAKADPPASADTPS